jgi:hypothetical protein
VAIVEAAATGDPDALRAAVAAHYAPLLPGTGQREQ